MSRHESRAAARRLRPLKRKFGPAIRIWLFSVWRSRTGVRNCTCSKEVN